METLGIDTTPEELDLMINEIDQDNNGEIDFDGTLPICAAMYSSRIWWSKSELSRIRCGHVKKSERFIHFRASEIRV